MKGGSLLQPRLLPWLDNVDLLLGSLGSHLGDQRKALKAHLPSGDAYLLTQRCYLGPGLGQCCHFHSTSSCSFSLAARELCQSEASPAARLALSSSWMPLNADLLGTSSRAINETSVSVSQIALCSSKLWQPRKGAFNKKKEVLKKRENAPPAWSCWLQSSCAAQSCSFGFCWLYWLTSHCCPLAPENGSPTANREGCVCGWV